MSTIIIHGDPCYYITTIAHNCYIINFVGKDARKDTCAESQNKMKKYKKGNYFNVCRYIHKYIPHIDKNNYYFPYFCIINVVGKNTSTDTVHVLNQKAKGSLKGLMFEQHQQGSVTD